MQRKQKQIFATEKERKKRDYIAWRCRQKAIHKVVLFITVVITWCSRDCSASTLQAGCIIWPRLRDFTSPDLLLLLLASVPKCSLKTHGRSVFMFRVHFTHIPLINIVIAGLTFGVRDSFLMKPTVAAELGLLFSAVPGTCLHLRYVIIVMLWSTNGRGRQAI